MATTPVQTLTSIPMVRSHELLLPSTSTPPDQTHPPYPTAPQESPLPLSASLKPTRYKRRATRRHYVEVESDEEGGKSMRNDEGDCVEYGEIGGVGHMTGVRSRGSTTAKSTSSAPVVGDTLKRTKRICIAVGTSDELSEQHTARLGSRRLTDLLSAYSATPNPDECRTRSAIPNKAGRKCSEGRPCDRCRQRGYTDCRDAPRLRQAGSNAGSNLRAARMMTPETHRGCGQNYSVLDPQIVALSPCRSRSFFLPSPAPPVVRRPSKPSSLYSSLDTRTPPSFTPPPSPTPLYFPSPRYSIPDSLPHLDYPLKPLPSPHLPPLLCPRLITPINRLSPPHRSTSPNSRFYKPTLKLPSIRSLFFSGEEDVDRWKKRLFDESNSAARGAGMGQARFRTSFERTSAKGVGG